MAQRHTRVHQRDIQFHNTQGRSCMSAVGCEGPPGLRRERGSQVGFHSQGNAVLEKASEIRLVLYTPGLITSSLTNAKEYRPHIIRF